MPGSSGFALAELAEQLGAQLVGEPEVRITGIATLQEAQVGDISFLANPRYRKYLAGTQASAVILSPLEAENFRGNALLLDNPYQGYARLTALFAPASGAPSGIHPSAVVAESAQVDPGAVIGPLVVVEAGAVIESGVHIGAGSFVGENAHIGGGSLLHSNVSVYHDCRIGRRAVLHSGVVIGADGFGFAPHEAGWTKIHHLAGVRIGDDVELGAGTCVDRGALSDTEIEDGVKMDNMVQIAHGVKVGAHTVIAGCTAVAGSTEIGRRCVIAGGVGIVGHIRIAEKVTITAMTLVTRSIDQPGSYSAGTPMAPTREWRKLAVRFGQLDDIHERLKRLENKDS